jgi:hypothetical protein
MPEPLTMVYTHDQETGLPRLKIKTGHLKNGEVQKFEEEIHRRYDSLLHCGNDGKDVEFDTKLSGKGSPTKFRVRVYNAGKRCPVLVFDSPAKAKAETTTTTTTTTTTESNQPATANDAVEPADWRAGFLDNIEQAFPPDLELDEAEETGLRYVLKELRRLAQDQPRDIGLLLLACYIASSIRVYTEEDEGQRGLYLLASQAVKQIWAKHDAEGLNGVNSLDSARFSGLDARAASWVPRRLWGLLHRSNSKK